ncbi:MAG: division/cell wall cluster transcriptional repressor MraZ [Oscillospiraceae bacterium]|nr:division/cell wall cluster transcriptional repressor MraZ [Oscillospiraceae bacterium]
MTGQYPHSIDAKGRLFIPAKLREELGETFYVTISMTDRCLTVYSEDGWEKLMEKFDSLPYTEARKAARLVFANAAKCDPDSQGRILLPQKLRDYAGLKKDVIVAGVSKRAEIWDAEKWTEMETAGLEGDDLLSIAAALGM